MQLGELGEFVPMWDQFGRPRVVQEYHRSSVPLVDERAQHRQHRGDPTATADQQHSVRSPPRQLEHPGGRFEVDDHARLRVLVQIARNQSVRMHPDGELDPAVPAQFRCHR